METRYWLLLASGVGTVEACKLLGIGRKTGYRWRAGGSVSNSGSTPETLRGWVTHAEVDAGERAGTTTAEATRIAELEREVRGLCRANEILRTATALIPAAELDRHLK